MNDPLSKKKKKKKPNKPVLKFLSSFPNQSLYTTCPQSTNSQIYLSLSSLNNQSQNRNQGFTFRLGLDSNVFVLLSVFAFPWMGLCIIYETRKYLF